MTGLHRQDVYFLILIFLFFSSINTFSFQRKMPDEEFLAFADVMPSPVGGFAQIYKNVRYPQSARDSGIEGKVYLMAYVDEEGTVLKCSVIRGIGFGCDEAAVKAVEASKFTPGKNSGNPVKVKFSMFVIFHLQY